METVQQLQQWKIKLEKQSAEMYQSGINLKDARQQLLMEQLSVIDHAITEIEALTSVITDLENALIHEHHLRQNEEKNHKLSKQMSRRYFFQLESHGIQPSSHWGL